MIHVFAKSEIGYSHIKNKQPLQDYSSCYSDVNRKIITCCDGHGGKTYIRSNKGSMMASEAVNSVLYNLNYYDFFKYDEDELENKIKLDILCAWNKLVEKDLSENHISKKELEGLEEHQIDRLRANPTKAYGTTLTGAMVLRNKLVVVGIGDSETIIVSKGEMKKVFDDDDAPAANQTYSMCQEDAFEYIQVKILDFKEIDGVILCTDGLAAPYQSYENFNNSFIKPLFKRLIAEEGINYISSYVSTLAKEIGIGDDVSLAFIIDDTASKRYYK